MMKLSRRPSRAEILCSTLTAAALAMALAPGASSAQCWDNWGDVNDSGSVDVADVQCQALVALSALMGVSPAPECLAISAAMADLTCNANPGGVGQATPRVDIHDVNILIYAALEIALPSTVDFNGDGCPDSCQAVCQDLICDEEHGESCSDCPFDCGLCVDSCCLEQAVPGCNNPDIEACVCSISEFCCIEFWDGSCVATAEEFCTAECFVPQCAIENVLSCGEVIQGTTNGAPSDVTSYGCGGGSYGGGERFYAIQPDAAYPAKLTMTKLSGGTLSMFLLGDDCASTNCLQKGAPSITFTTEADATYYVAIDGAAGAAGAYSLALTCANDCDPAAICGAKQCGNALCNGFTISCGTCAGGTVCDSAAGQCVVPTVEGCPGTGDCLLSNGTPGCEELECCVLVCEQDLFCCESGWDSVCAGLADEQCDPDPCGDGICAAADGENCSSCPADCSCSGGSECVGTSCIACEQATVCSVFDCGTTTCGGTEFTCGDCPSGETCGKNYCYACGDGLCEAAAGENCGNCEADCACETGACAGGKCVTSDNCAVTDPPTTISCGQTIIGNTAQGVNLFSSYSCTTWNESGPEIVYVFNAPDSTLVDLNLQVISPSTDLDLFVLEPGCDSQSCVEYGSSGTEFTAVEGETYFIAVDGFQGDVGEFKLTLQCESSCSVEALCDANSCGTIECFGNTYNCGDCAAGGACGSANQCVPCGDGTCDTAAGESCVTCDADCGCGDDVCNSDGECVVAELCDLSQALPIGCGATVSGNNGELGVSAIDGYNCVSWNQSGPEVVYEFHAPAAGTIAYEIDSVSDLDVFILSPSCSDESCYDYASLSGDFQAQKGQTYYVVVDGYNGNVSNYSLSLSCDLACDKAILCADKECGTVGCANNGQVDCGTCSEGVCGSDGLCALCGDGTCSTAASENCANCAQDCPCDGAGASCSSTGVCTIITPCALGGNVPELSCGDVYSGTTVGGGSNLSDYSCTTANEAGPESYVSFSPKSSDTVIFELTSSSNQKMFLMPTVCADKECVEANGSSLLLDAAAGDTYYIAVDGGSSSAGAYTIEVICASENCTTEQICDPGSCGPVECVGNEYDCGACPSGQFCVDGQCGSSPFPECPGTGSCTVSKSTVGCEDEACCVLVCQDDAFCCSSSWDSLCASSATELCGP